MRKIFYLILSKFHKVFEFWFRGNLRVLAYHTVVDQDLFEQQLKFLRRTFSIIDIQELHDFLFHNKELPKKPLLITFDDGDVSVLEKGLPLLKKYKLPSILFVITGLIDTSNSFWWRRVENSFEKEGKSYSKARAKVKYLKGISNEQRENYLKSLKEFEAKQLSIEQLRSLEKERIYIGNHSNSHPMLNKCTDSEIAKEFQASKDKFSEWGLPGYSIFAYPNGNWDNRTEELLKKYEVKVAFLFDHRVNKQEIHPLRISRIAVDSDLELAEFKAKVSGLHPFLLNLKKDRNVF